MYATGDRIKGTHKTKANEGVADGEANQVDRLVDVEKVSIVMLPDGFGVHEAYTEIDSFGGNATNHESGIFRNRHHRLYHGHFREGDYHEGTLHTNCGVYSGTFLSNEPSHGKMKYSDTILITGGYALTPEVDDSPLGPNPYRRGLHHSHNVKIKYHDGAAYDGEMQHGSITGIGVYKQPTDST